MACCSSGVQRRLRTSFSVWTLALPGRRCERAYAPRGAGSLRRPNQDVAAVLNHVKGTHAFDKGRCRHPDPAGTGRVDVHDKKRVGFCVVRTDRRNVAAAALAYRLAPVVDDHIITATFEVVDKLGTDVLLCLAVVDDGEFGDCAVGPEHLVELADLVTEVSDLLAVDRYRLAQYLRARLLALADHVVLGKARKRRIETARNVLEIFRAQTGPIAREIAAPSANGVEHDGRRRRTTKCHVGLGLELIGQRWKIHLGG